MCSRAILSRVSPQTHTRRVVLEGWGVHTGEPSRVVLSAGTPGTPVIMRSRGQDAPEARVDQLSVASTHRATVVERSTPAGALRVATVEHLFAALAGLGIYDGLVVEVEEPELPLLDGGAARWASAIDSLGSRPEQAPRCASRAAR